MGRCSASWRVTQELCAPRRVWLLFLRLRGVVPVSHRDLSGCATTRSPSIVLRKGSPGEFAPPIPAGSRLRPRPRAVGVGAVRRIRRRGSPPEPGWTHASWSVRDGLPVLTFSGLCQSRDGYLVVSTFDGLVRFDGARFTVIDAARRTGADLRAGSRAWSRTRAAASGPTPRAMDWCGSSTARPGRCAGAAGRSWPFRDDRRRPPGHCVLMSADGVFEATADSARRLDATPIETGAQLPVRDRDGAVWWAGTKAITWTKAGQLRRLALPEGLTGFDVVSAGSKTRAGAVPAQPRPRVARHRRTHRAAPARAVGDSGRAHARA